MDCTIFKILLNWTQIIIGKYEDQTHESLIVINVNQYHLFVRLLVVECDSFSVHKTHTA